MWRLLAGPCTARPYHESPALLVIGAPLPRSIRGRGTTPPIRTAPLSPRCCPRPPPSRGTVAGARARPLGDQDPSQMVHPPCGLLRQRCDPLSFLLPLKRA